MRIKYCYMKKIVIPVLAVVLLGACQNSGKQEPAAQAADTAVKKMDSAQMQASQTDRFAGVQFASQRDTICNMSLKSGIEDTLHLGDKIYGFCSSDCKAEFAAQLVKEKKR